MNNNKIRNKNKILIIISALFIGFLIWIIDSIILTYFYPYYSDRFLDNFILNVKQHDLLFHIVLLFLLIILGVIVAYLNDRESRYRYELEAQYTKVESILNLTTSISNVKEIDEKTVITNLLDTAINLIPEADYGMAFIYDEDDAILIKVVGHSATLLDINYKDISTQRNIPLKEIFIVKEIKEILLKYSDQNTKKLIKDGYKDTKETMFLVLSVNQKKLAAISLDISKDSNRTFTQESIEALKLIKNIPSAFYTMSMDYKLKENLHKEIIASIIKILSLHNPYTKKHSQNVAQISRRIALNLEMNDNEIEHVYWTGLVHDIGKILIAHEILDKKGKLTNHEYETMKKHPVWGYESLNSNKQLSKLAEYVLYHHERWDGKGYPKGLLGDDIPLVSRIIAIADTYDAMTSDRPYRKALSSETAIREIEKSAGTQFDPQLVKVFLALYKEKAMC